MQCKTYQRHTSRHRNPYTKPPASRNKRHHQQQQPTNKQLSTINNQTDQPACGSVASHSQRPPRRAVRRPRCRPACMHACRCVHDVSATSNNHPATSSHPAARRGCIVATRITRSTAPLNADDSKHSRREVTEQHGMTPLRHSNRTRTHRWFDDLAGRVRRSAEHHTLRLKAGQLGWLQVSDYHHKLA